jgi:UDP-glucose 4-epimerase
VKKLSADKEIIFHLAALIGIPYSYVAPTHYVSVNISGTVNVLEAAKESGARVIHTSTSETYGTAQYTPIDEKHPLVGQSPYSASKISADKMAESYHRAFGIPVVIVRPFNTYGPKQSARAVIPTIMSQLASGYDKIELGSLSPVRDLTYVEDTVRGFLCAASSKEAIGDTINLGYGMGVSIGELAEKIIEISGKNAAVASKEERIRPDASEVMELISDNSKAKEILNWEPEVTLEDGLQRTYEYIVKNIERYKPGIYNI